MKDSKIDIRFVQVHHFGFKPHEEATNKTCKHTTVKDKAREHPDYATCPHWIEPKKSWNTSHGLSTYIHFTTCYDYDVAVVPTWIFYETSIFNFIICKYVSVIGSSKSKILFFFYSIKY